MAKYIIRLDDACPSMDTVKWNRMEEMLEKHNITPIVGIIPDNKDPLFNYGYDNEFWEKCIRWQEKKWTIAIHGLNHSLFTHKPEGYFQKSHSTNSEWAGIPFEKQYDMLLTGMDILKTKGIFPSCFFAPCHTYDINTVKAIKIYNEDNRPLYISDGYALRPYKKNDVWFLPSLFDSPHKIGGNGYYTFVFHPNNMSVLTFDKLEEFLNGNDSSFVNADQVMMNYMNQKELGQGIVGYTLEQGIYIARGIRKLVG